MADLKGAQVVPKVNYEKVDDDEMKVSYLREDIIRISDIQRRIDGLTNDIAEMQKRFDAAIAEKQAEIDKLQVNIDKFNSL